MIARRQPARLMGMGPVSSDTPVAVRIWFGRCLAMSATLLLIAAVNLALYAAIGGVRVPGDQPYRWDRADPVHVAVRSGTVSCAYSAEGGPLGTVVTGYDLVLASVIRGRTIPGRAAGQGPNILLCDGPVTVTAGWAVRAYPLAGSWLRFAAYLLAMLVGALLARPEGTRSERKRSGRSTTTPLGVADRRGNQPIDRLQPKMAATPPNTSPAADPARTSNSATGTYSGTTSHNTTTGYGATAGDPDEGDRRRGDPGGRGRPAWANANLKTARIRADAAVRPMRFGRTTYWGHRLIQDTAMLMAGVAGLGVMPLLLVVFGSLPPSYVTYPVVAGVIIGCYLLLSRKLYDYRLGRRWQPGPQPRPQRNDPPKNSTTEQERPPP